jgi:FAD/FMN-containing dehydrogenase/Fe-S oxidoreductase
VKDARAVDESQRERIHDDLKGIMKGDLHFDEIARALYSTDASIFQVKPLGVVAPRDEDDVRALVRYAAEHQLPLIPRGAGTGLAGESLGAGLLVDMSRHFRTILEIGPDFVRVQPGVVCSELNARLAKMGRRFAPEPTGPVQCTMGGMLATNASGIHALRHGYTRDHVQNLCVVFADGEAACVGREPVPQTGAVPSGRLEVLVAQVAALLATHQELIQRNRPRTRYNRCGYLLHDVLDEGTLDLARLLTGSEGTLAFFTQATLRTAPLPVGRSLVLLGFDSVDQALRATGPALANRPTACELIDRRLVSLARGGALDLKPVVPAEAEAVLLIEFEADSQAEASAQARALAERCQRQERLALYAVTATDAPEIQRLWRLRETVLPNLYKLRGGAQPVAFVEDVGVPTGELANYLHSVQEILRTHETTASFLVHAGTGQVHTRPFLDLQKKEDVVRLWALAEEIHALALNLGGTVSSQHGTGLARTPWVARQYGALYPVLRELKGIFDPHHILNPGKIIGPDPAMPAWPLRGAPAAAESPSRLLLWQAEEVRTEAFSCNGCGHCRTEDPRQRMCPIFRATHEEAATPRAKANLLRHLLQDAQGGRQLSSDEVREVADLCVNCRMCASECPAHVNIPKLMLEAKAANVAEHGMDRTDWAMAQTENFAAIGSALAPLVNGGMSNGPLRWLLEKLLGLSRKRRLPRFAARSFMRRAARRGWMRRPHGHRPRVAYFVDVFANYNDPEIAEAVVAVLHHNGIEVFVPPGQRGCGMAPFAYGDIETAREMAAHNLRILADVAREGYTIVCSEPTAALMLRHDYPALLDDPDVELVAGRVVELTAFLWELHQSGDLRSDFQPLKLCLGHHVPCHLKALGRSACAPALLSLIPELLVHTIDVGCSGMAGTFGLKGRNYDVSMSAGRALFQELSRPAVLFGSTECSTCRVQMVEGSGKPTLHPVQYLACAYGLMPSLLRRLRRAGPGTVLQ